MGKRKHKHYDKDIRRKIRRLEDKLRHSRRKDLDRGSDTSTSSSSRRPYYNEQLSDIEGKYSESGEDWMLREEALMDDEIYDSSLSLAPQLQSVINNPTASPSAVAPAPALPQMLATPTVPATPAVPQMLATPTAPAAPAVPQMLATPTAPAAPAPEPVAPASEPVASVQTNSAQSTAPTEKPSTSALPQEILSMLGEAKRLDEPLGEHIPDELSERWGKILMDGLAKELKQSLADKMPIPGNFLLARAPKLNPEVSAVINDSARNRDMRLEKAQNQLGRGIAGLAKLTKDLIRSDLNKLEIIKKISEVTQILLDLHYEESINRNKLLVPLLDKKFWNTIKGVKRDEYLFGEKLGDKIKNSKDIEKSGQQIKKSFTFHPAFHHRKPATQPGNARAPPRQYKPKATSAPTTGRYYEPQPSTSGRRTNSSQRRGRPYSTNKVNERSRR